MRENNRRARLFGGGIAAALGVALALARVVAAGLPALASDGGGSKPGKKEKKGKGRGRNGEGGKKAKKGK